MKWLALFFSVLLGVLCLWSQAQPGGAPADGSAFSFSGYEWRVKTSRGNVGPGPNLFGANAVEVDSHGRLHLRIFHDGGRWICSEVISRRSFGFGDYRFVVRDTARLDRNVVAGFFIWDPQAAQTFFREADAEISRWGDDQAPNGQFVLQPFVRPGNRVRFELPPGRVELSFRWSPGRMLFRAVARGSVIHEHLFTKGVPDPDQTNVRLNMWLYKTLPPADGETQEVVVESFKFLPIDQRR